MGDLGEDPALTKRVAEALHAVATPFTAGAGRQKQFPHNFVTRGQKQQKTELGELSMGEYIWGLIQLIKSKDPLDEAIPYMNQHLERVVEALNL